METVLEIVENGACLLMFNLGNYFTKNQNYLLSSGPAVCKCSRKVGNSKYLEEIKKKNLVLCFAS